ncbi:MAG: nuclear transport factor 2 family protein [Pyrinomonadaceae bacterium]
MSQKIADKFIEALHKLEESRDLETITGVFAEDAEVGNIVAPEKFNGRGGAREFWTKYRDTFGEVHSTFRNIIVTDNSAALEWTTEGTTNGGAPIKYEGVSVLETKEDAITRFRAYFDAGNLGRQVAQE